MAAKVQHVENIAACGTTTHYPFGLKGLFVEVRAIEKDRGPLLFRLLRQGTK
jgi:hypothetical protein